jgi:hypothetical protein
LQNENDSNNKENRILLQNENDSNNTNFNAKKLQDLHRNVAKVAKLLYFCRMQAHAPS